MSLCDTFMSDQAKCVYFAIVIVILLLAFLRVKGMAERLENPNYLYTSGATQRFFQEDTSANRGDYTTGYNFQAPVSPAAHASMAKAAAAAKAKSEAMTASPDEMDLWAVGQDLGAYKDGITGQTRGLDAGRHGMGMKNMTTEHMQDDVYESLLQQQTLTGA